MHMTIFHELKERKLTSDGCQLNINHFQDDKIQPMIGLENQVADVATEEPSRRRSNWK